MSLLLASVEGWDVLPRLCGGLGMPCSPDCGGLGLAATVLCAQVMSNGRDQTFLPHRELQSWAWLQTGWKSLLWLGVTPCGSLIRDCTVRKPPTCHGFPPSSSLKWWLVIIWGSQIPWRIRVKSWVHSPNCTFVYSFAYDVGGALAPRMVQRSGALP